MNVTIAGRTFTADTEGGDTMFLTGPRGGVFFLRPFGGEQTGRYEVISWKSGAPLRDRCQRAIRVLWIGDVIEQITT